MVFAVTATAAGKLTCCQPVALSLVNVALASRCPLVVHRLPTWVPVLAVPFQNRTAVMKPSTSERNLTPSSTGLAVLLHLVDRLGGRGPEAARADWVRGGRQRASGSQRAVGRIRNCGTGGSAGGSILRIGDRRVRGQRRSRGLGSAVRGPDLGDHRVHCLGSGPPSQSQHAEQRHYSDNDKTPASSPHVQSPQSSDHRPIPGRQT